MYMPEKIHNINEEMNWLNVDILGIGEKRLPSNGKMKIDDSTVPHSGNNDPNPPNGVGIIPYTRTSSTLPNFVPLPDRTMMIDLSAILKNFNIFQVHAPTEDKSEWDIQAFMRLMS